MKIFKKNIIKKILKIKNIITFFVLLYKFVIVHLDSHLLYFHVVNIEYYFLVENFKNRKNNKKKNLFFNIRCINRMKIGNIRKNNQFRDVNSKKKEILYKSSYFTKIFG